jgi:hypothetical protein
MTPNSSIVGDFVTTYMATDITAGNDPARIWSRARLGFSGFTGTSILAAWRSGRSRGGRL